MHELPIHELLNAKLKCNSYYHYLLLLTVTGYTLKNKGASRCHMKNPFVLNGSIKNL